MDPVIIHGILPLPCTQFRRLVLRKKDSDAASARKGTATGWNECKKTLMLDPKKTWMMEEGENLEVICQAQDYHDLKKVLKSQRKVLSFSLDKKADDMLSQTQLSTMIERKICETLLSRGWCRLQESLFVKSRMSPADDGKILQAATMSLHFSDDQNFIFLVKPAVFRTRHLQVVNMLPQALQEKLSKEGSLDLGDWIASISEEQRVGLKCVCLPSSRQGWIHGISLASSKEVASSSLARRSGLEASEDVIYSVVMDETTDSETTFEIASSCVLTAGGLLSVPFLQQKSCLGGAVSSLVLDMPFEVLSAGQVTFTSDVSQPRMGTFDLNWSVASSRIQEKGVTGVQPNIVESDALWRRPKPVLFVGKGESEDVAVPLARKAAKEVTSLPKVPLMVPKFGPRKVNNSGGNTVKRKAPEVKEVPGDGGGGHEKRFKVSAQPARRLGGMASGTGTVGKSVKSVQSGSQASKSKPPIKNSISKEDAKKSGDKQVASKKLCNKQGAAVNPCPKSNVGRKAQDAAATKTASTEATPKIDSLTKGSSKKESDKKHAAKKLVPKNQSEGEDSAKNQGNVESEEIDSLVREKFAAGKLKTVNLSQLKRFITKHKLGKVGGKKEELLKLVESFLLK